MHNFTPGQRWVSDNDAALGLGIVQSVAFRTVQLEFPAADETRTYAKDNAPLTRVIYKPGWLVSLDYQSRTWQRHRALPRHSRQWPNDHHARM